MFDNSRESHQLFRTRHALQGSLHFCPNSAEFVPYLVEIRTVSRPVPSGCTCRHNHCDCSQHLLRFNKWQSFWNYRCLLRALLCYWFYLFLAPNPPPPRWRDTRNLIGTYISKNIISIYKLYKLNSSIWQKKQTKMVTNSTFLCNTLFY